MPSDPQNKAERPDGNVVPLHRAELVASIERKLSEARRFFSLRDYGSCEELVQEVLAADPQNSRAKALLDLSSIKLSKRKLYKKIAEAQSPAVLPGTPDFESNVSTAPDPPESQPALEVSRVQSDLVSSPPVAASVTLSSRRRRGLPESSADLPQDTIRERTISALVDLLKNKEMTPQDWQGDTQARTVSPMPPPPSVPPSELAKPLVDEQQSSFFPNVHVSQPGPFTSDQPRSPGLVANRDFLPGSLDELFEAAPVPLVTPPRGEPRPPIARTGVVPQKNVPATAAESSPPAKFSSVTKT